MKRLAIALLIVLLSVSLLVPAASAAVTDTLDYSVSATKVTMTADGTGSFDITVPGSTTPYAGVEFVVKMPDGVKISTVNYSLTNVSTMSPEIPPGGQKPNTYYFSCYALENKFTAALTCTVNVAYTVSPVTEKTLTVVEIKKYTLDGNKTVDLVSNKTTAVTLAPAGSGSSTGTGTGGSTTVPDTDPPLALPFPFTDVAASDWFYNDVLYMWNNSLMDGTSATLFSPNLVLTRGMVVTVLYRHEGKPAVTSLNMPFTDVAAGQWYTDAVKWAADKEIVLGYPDNRFAPNDNVTREQLAAILHRYQAFTKLVPTETVAARVFTDANSISSYAREAVNVLVKQDIIKGKPDGTFNPAGSATRAEFAAMLHRYLASVQS